MTYDEFANKYGVFIEPTLVEDGGPDGVSRWRIKVCRDLPLAPSLHKTVVHEFDYSAGAGHRHFTKHAGRIAIQFGTKTYRPGDRVPQYFGRLCVDDAETLKRGTAPTPPTAGSMLECLAVDYSFVSGGQTRDEFLDEMYGPTADIPRSAINDYDKLLETSQKLRALFSASELEELERCEEE